MPASKPNSGTSNGIRISLSLLVGVACGIFILLWDGHHMSHGPAPEWVGSYVILPLIAAVLSFFCNCLTQFLNCRDVQWSRQLLSVSVVPAPFIAIFLLLWLIPVLRWPVEGLVQEATPEFQKGLSSGYYGFWIGMYVQNYMGGMAQLCPN